jgi:lysophospholipase L1-like esterase
MTFVTRGLRDRPMPTIHGALMRTAATALFVGTLAGCEHDELATRPRTPVNGTLFASYVAMGNSITAGYQSGGIVDTTQQESYAAVIAQQAGTRFAIPSMQYPGCPPPIVNFQTQARLGGGTATTCGLRTAGSVTAVLNNVAVPGAITLDPTSVTTSASNALTMFILGGQTQVQRALDADPTFVSIEIGNNDVLSAAEHGTVVPEASIGSPGVTPVDTVVAEYATMLAQLTKARPSLKGLLVGVFDVTALPSLFPAESLYSNATFNAEFTDAAGGSVTYVPNCAGSHALIAIGIIQFWQEAGIPPVISCQAGVPVEPYGDFFVLDTAKQRVIGAAVSGYNAYISAKADSLGWAYVDPNIALGALKASGAIPTLPNFASATQTFGSYITLDGIHPSALAHKLLANVLIQGINTKYGVSIDTVSHQ